MSAEMIRPAAVTFAAIVGDVADDGLDAPTPCAEFDVRALVGHLLQWGPSLVGAAEKTAVPPAEVVVTAESWGADLLGHLDALATAWSMPTAWEGATTMGGPTEMPAPLVGGMVVGELVVHGWDLARATARPGPRPHGPRPCLGPADEVSDASDDGCPPGLRRRAR